MLKESGEKDLITIIQEQKEVDPEEEDQDDSDEEGQDLF